MKFFILMLSCFPLFACGPKEIGYSPAEQTAAGGTGASAAELMRYPLIGSNNTQIMLYNTNRPQIMEQAQKWNSFQFRRQLGLNPLPDESEAHEIPKQRSPFRQ